MDEAGYELPEEDHGVTGAEWLPEFDHDAEAVSVSGLMVVAKAPVANGVDNFGGLSRPPFVYHDANSHDPDVQIPVPGYKFTDI
jgi:hypothetical protein